MNSITRQASAVPFHVKSLLTIACAIAICSFHSYAAAPAPFWLSEFNAGIGKRDVYFESLNVSAHKDAILSWDSSLRDSIRQRFEDFAQPDEPWYNFTNGMLLINASQSRAAYHFSRALSLADQDPGVTLVLAIEFMRYKQHIWAENALTQLEKQMFAAGGVSIPAVAQIFLTYGHLYDKAGNHGMAATCHKWAERFDSDQIWSPLSKARSGLPMRPGVFVSGLIDAAKRMGDSWQLQLVLSHFVYRWIRLLIFFFVVAVFLVYGLKYLPKALHQWTDYFPAVTPPVLRSALGIALLLSFGSFGFLPLAWLLLFLIWRFLEGHERVLVFSVAIIMVLVPLDTKFEDSFVQLRLPDSPVQLYSRAVKEGSSENFSRAALENARKHSGDFLSQLSGAIAATKLGEFPAAKACAQSALQLRPEDPLALIAAGNTSFLSEDLADAQKYYARAVTVSPGNASARFNLAQCHLRRMETVAGTDVIRDAIQIEPTMINTFIRMNDLHFSKDWPALRMIMPPSCPPDYFWSSLFLPYGGSWKSAQERWGVTMAGIPLIPSCIISLILAIALIAYDKLRHDGHGPRKLFSCRFCGCTICRRCKRGMLCVACASATQYVRNENSLHTIKMTLVEKAQRSNMLAGYVLDMVFPGTGMLFSRRTTPYVSVLLVIISSAIYASYAFIAQLTFWYPQWVIRGFDTAALALPAFYSLYFLTKGLTALYRVRHAPGSNY